MEFVLPEITIPQDKINAYNSLITLMSIRDDILSKYRESFNKFWNRSDSEINSELEAMDSVKPGQSINFFFVCRELVEFLYSVSDDKVAPQEFEPKKQMIYVDSNNNYTQDVQLAVGVRIYVQ